MLEQEDGNGEDSAAVSLKSIGVESLTQDGWVAIYDEIDAAGLGTAASIYFMLAIGISGFIFANIIVGVVVMNLQNTVREEKKMKTKY